jgi:hypothetical protein
MHIEVFHSAEVRTLVIGIEAIMLIQPALLRRLYLKRKRVGNSNYLQICLGFLLFVPILLLGFRSIAPSWITNVEIVGSVLVFVWLSCFGTDLDITSRHPPLMIRRIYASSRMNCGKLGGRLEPQVLGAVSIVGVVRKLTTYSVIPFT